MDFVNPPRTFVLVDGILAPRLLAPIYRQFADSIELQGSEDVLEFGCGSGGVAERLAPRLQRGSLTCVDISPPLLRIASRRLAKHKHARCLVGRIEDLAFPKGSFDVVVIHNALHDVAKSDRISTIDALVQALRPGGRLQFREPTKPTHGLPPSTYRTLCTEAGLQEVQASQRNVFALGPAFDAVFIKPLRAAT